LDRTEEEGKGHKCSVFIDGGEREQWERKKPQMGELFPHCTTPGSSFTVL
jgi:hypothetical protein